MKLCTSNDVKRPCGQAKDLKVFVRKLRYISISIFLTLIFGLKTAEAQPRADTASYDVELRKNFPLLIRQVCGASLTSDCVSQSSEIQIYLRNLCGSVQADQRTGCLALASNLANEIIQRKNQHSSSSSSIKSESEEVAEIEARRQAEIVRDHQSKILRSQLEIQNKQKDIDDSREICKKILNNEEAQKYFKKISELVNLLITADKQFLHIKLPGFSDEKFRSWLINSLEITDIHNTSNIMKLSYKINSAIESCAQENKIIYYSFLSQYNTANDIVKAIKSNSNSNNLKLYVRISDIVSKNEVSSNLESVLFSFALTGGSDFYTMHKEKIYQKIDDEIRELNIRLDYEKYSQEKLQRDVVLEKDLIKETANFLEKLQRQVIPGNSIKEIKEREGFMGFLIDLFSAIIIIFSMFVIYGSSLLVKIRGILK